MNYMPVLHFGNELTNQSGFYMIAESDQQAFKIIKYLKAAIDAGYDPNEIDIDYTDINDPDRERIKYEIEKYYRER